MRLISSRRSLRHPEIKLLYDYLHTSETEMDRSKHYDWHQQALGVRYYFAAKLYTSATQNAFVCLSRARREGHVDPPTLELFARLVPHLERAVQIGQRFADLKLQAAAGTELIQHLPFGVILLVTDGRVIFLNQAAERIVNANDGLAMIDRRLCALRRIDDVPLQRLIGETLNLAASSTPPR